MMTLWVATNAVGKKTILVGGHFSNWLKPPLRTTTPTRTLYRLALKEESRALAAHL